MIFVFCLCDHFASSLHVGNSYRTERSHSKGISFVKSPELNSHSTIDFSNFSIRSCIRSYAFLQIKEWVLSTEALAIPTLADDRPPPCGAHPKGQKCGVTREYQRLPLKVL
jgi:hypothetical protein